MSNKLEEMKKRLLSIRPTAAILDQKIENQPNPIQVKEQSVSKSVQEQPIICEPSHQADDKNQDCQDKQNNSSPQKQAKVADNPQPLSLDKAPEDKKEPEAEAIQICQQQELQSGQIKRVEQPPIKKNEDQACNLELVDRNPLFSCSVDEQVRGSLNNLYAENEKSTLPIQMESKQQKKQQKIVLKELQLVKESIKNLKSSLKGLEQLQNMIAANPKIKIKVKSLLQEMNQTMNIPVTE